MKIIEFLVVYSLISFKLAMFSLLQCEHEDTIEIPRSLFSGFKHHLCGYHIWFMIMVNRGINFVCFLLLTDSIV